VEEQQHHLNSIVKEIGEAVLATTETVEQLARRVDDLAVQVKQQSQQVQQQGYQIFALCDAVQTLAEGQDRSLERLVQLTDSVERLLGAIVEEEEEPTD
jgi:ABC-type transporter Mla subunit MlaD